jgi:hypothetical protein
LTKDAAAQRLLLQLEKVKDLGHKVPDLCIVRLKGIQRSQVARSFFRSRRPRAPSLCLLEQVGDWRCVFI